MPSAAYCERITSAHSSSPTYVNAATRMPSRAIAMPEFETMPPVVSRSGSLSISRPPPIGSVSDTGRASTSTTHEPTTTQSMLLSIERVAEQSKACMTALASKSASSLLLGQLRFDRLDDFLANRASTFDSKRATTLPSRSNRNFSKFHLMSPANFGSVSFDVRYL